MIDTNILKYYNDFHKQRRKIKMNVDEYLDEIQIATAKLTNENKKYVIAVAQALLYTQKEEKGGHCKDMVIINANTFAGEHHEK